MSDTSRLEVRLTLDGVFRGMKVLGPFAAFSFPFGIAFGAAAIESGMTSAQSVFMSFIMFTGASQFAALEFWDGPLPTLSLLLTIFAIATRHILMGAVLSPWVNQLSRPQRIFALALMSDPNFADCSTAFQRGERDVGRLVGGGLILWATWILGTAIGSVAGSNLGDLKQYGFDVFMVTFFTTIILGQWQGKRSHLPFLVAAGVSVSGLYLLPTGWNIVTAAVAGGITGAVMHGR